MQEIWKDIKGYEGIYQVSNMGNIRSLNYRKMNQNKILKLDKDINGYLNADLNLNGKREVYKVHRLVAEAFIENKHNKKVINHKNGIREDNRVENLEWCTSSYNNTNIVKRQYKNVKRNRKEIEQYDENNNLIKTWNSISTASIETGISYPNICSCCKGRLNSAGGYIWKYKTKTKFCNNCGLQVDKEDKFCRNCGKEF